MNIFEALREDHDKQRKILAQMVKTSGDTAERSKLYEELKKELHIHADAEERHFYIPLIRNEKTQDKARHSIAEHQEIDELLSELDTLAHDSSAWLKIAKNLKEKVEHHLEEEEHSVFQMAGKVLLKADKESLAKQYQKYMSEHR